MMSSTSSSAARAEPRRRLLDAAYIATVVGCSKTALWHRLRRGAAARGELPPATKIGRNYVFDETTLNEWLDELDRRLRAIPRPRRGRPRMADASRLQPKGNADEQLR